MNYCFSIPVNAIIVSTLLLGAAARAQVHQGFAKRFLVERNKAGQITAVRAKKFVTQVGIGPFIGVLVEALAQLPKVIKQGPTSPGVVDPGILQFEEKLDELFSDSLGIGAQMGPGQKLVAGTTYPEELKTIKQGLHYLAQTEGAKEQSQAAAKQAMEDPELKLAAIELGKIAIDLRPDVLAKPADPTHYFRQYVVDQAFQQILNLVIKKLPSIPYLGVIRSVLQDLSSVFEDQRTYQQYLLMNYLTLLKPEELGLSPLEVGQVLSSVYADQLKLQAAVQLRQLKEQWDSYGLRRYEQQLMATNNEIRLGKEATAYLEGSRMLNWIYGEVFMDVKAKGTSFWSSSTGKAKTRRIYNFGARAYMFSKQPSLVWDELHPQKVKITRLLIKLGQMGIDALPIPGIIKSAANQFAQSTYQQQRLMEGALVGYAELYPLAGWSKMMPIIKGQTLHPYFQ